MVGVERKRVGLEERHSRQLSAAEQPAISALALASCGLSSPVRFSGHHPL